MLLSAPLLSSDLSLSLLETGSSLCRAITLCFMHAVLTLAFTHIAAGAPLCALHLRTLLLQGGINCLQHILLYGSFFFLGCGIVLFKSLKKPFTPKLLFPLKQCEA